MKHFVIITSICLMFGTAYCVWGPSVYDPFSENRSIYLPVYGEPSPYDRTQKKSTGMFDIRKKEYLPSTVDIAANEKYFPFMYRLRSKANEYLNNLISDMRLEIQQAKSENRIVFAQTREAFYHNLYQLASDRIDEAFNKISKIIVLEGDYLDNYHAPEFAKRDLVGKSKDLAEKLIEPLLTKNLQTLVREYINP